MGLLLVRSLSKVPPTCADASPNHECNKGNAPSSIESSLIQMYSGSYLTTEHKHDAGVVSHLDMEDAFLAMDVDNNKRLAMSECITYLEDLQRKAHVHHLGLAGSPWDICNSLNIPEQGLSISAFEQSFSLIQTDEGRFFDQVLVNRQLHSATSSRASQLDGILETKHNENPPPPTTMAPTPTASPTPSPTLNPPLPTTMAPTTTQTASPTPSPTLAPMPASGPRPHRGKGRPTPSPTPAAGKGGKGVFTQAKAGTSQQSRHDRGAAANGDTLQLDMKYWFSDVDVDKNGRLAMDECIAYFYYPQCIDCVHHLGVAGSPEDICKSLNIPEEGLGWDTFMDSSSLIQTDAGMSLGQVLAGCISCMPA